MNKKKITTFLAIFLAAVTVLSPCSGLFMGILPIYVSAASSGEIQNQIDQLEQQQSQLQQQIDQLEGTLVENNKDIKNMVARKSGIDQQIALLH